MAISDWPIDRRPRERLLAEGPEGLLDAELLAVLLRTGVQGKDAIELGRELLVRFGGITGLLSAGLQLLDVKGLGQAKTAQFAAAMELARRAMREELAARAGLTSPANVRDYLRVALGHRPYEVFVCIWLDAQHKVIATEEAFKGTLTQTSVYPREIVKKALARNAAAVIFAHNHPSGVAQPSQSDELLTKNLQEALALIEVKVLDHFIIAGSQAISFAERGLL
jgi:DNA repair protein RadC